MARTLDLAKRKAIFTAAKSIFSEDGYAMAKMSDIAAEAGVAPGTLYLYYESKESLASAIGEEFYSRLIAQICSIAREMEDPDGITKLVDRALQIAEEEHAVLTMVKERNSNAKTKLKGRVRFVDQMTEVLTDLTNRGVIRKYDDVHTLAELVLALMRRLLMSYAVFGDETTGALREGAITTLQHILFDDVTVAANKLIKQRNKRKI